MQNDLAPESQSQLDELRDHQEAIEGIQRGYEDFKAGRVSPVAESFERLRVKHGLPR